MAQQTNSFEVVKFSKKNWGLLVTFSCSNVTFERGEQENNNFIWLKIPAELIEHFTWQLLPLNESGACDAGTLTRSVALHFVPQESPIPSQLL